MCLVRLNYADAGHITNEKKEKSHAVHTCVSHNKIMALTGWSCC